MLRVFLGIVVLILVGLHLTITYLNSTETDEGSENQESLVSGMDSNTKTLKGKDNIWLLLEKTSYQQKDSLVFEPVFPTEVLDLDKKEIVIQGFMYPLSENKMQNHFILSYYPLESCFFCGMAGPETIMEVYTREKVAIEKKLLSLKGILSLNRQSSDKPFFTLQEAVKHQF